VKETASSKKQKLNQSTIDRLAQNLVKLVEMFREDGPASDYKWWGGETPHTVYTAYPDYQRGHRLFDGVVEDVLRLNPDMLSKSEVERQLTYEFLEQQVIRPEQLGEQELMNKARDHLAKLASFEACQDLDFPIVNLRLERKPVKLGRVTFMVMTKQDIKRWQKNYDAQMRGISNIHVLARVHAPGDMSKAFSYARTQLNFALDVLRVLCFPFGHIKDSCGIGALGEVGFGKSTPVRINQRQFAIHYESPFDASSYATFELRKQILSKLKQPQLALINKLILTTEHSRSKMENKLLDGIHWLAESTKPDTNRARFVKIGFALETLISSEAEDEELKVRGITAMLAERAAFVAGKDLDDRLAIDRDIRRYYGMRSDIVHGGGRDTPLDNINSFGVLVRRIILGLLEKLDKPGDDLGTVEELEKWVRTQRYTLPRQS
jgi:hypothetical protein